MALPALQAGPSRKDKPAASQARTRRLKILFCALAYHPTQAGGAEHQAQLQAEELARRGHDVTVVCAGSPGVRSGSVNGVEVRRLRLVYRRPFKTLTHLSALTLYLLRNGHRFDIIHVHLANLQADVAVAAASLFGKPSYLKLAAGGRRGEIARMQRVAFLTRLFGIRHATVVQAISEEIGRDLAGANVKRERILRVPNGLDTALFHPISAQEKRELRRRLDLPETGEIVLYVGRFARYKGIPELLSAWRRMQVPTAKLVLVGAMAVDDALDKLPDGEDLIVRPWTDAVAAYYQASDIFVLPSHVEGMSNAMLEAMACGLPVVATRVGAAPDLLAGGRCGVLVDPGDADALVEAMRGLLLNPSECRQTGKAAAVLVREQFAIEAVVDQIEAAYYGVCSS